MTNGFEGESFGSFSLEEMPYFGESFNRIFFKLGILRVLEKKKLLPIFFKMAAGSKMAVWAKLVSTKNFIVIQRVDRIK